MSELHRDDFDFEEFQKLEAKLLEEHPGAKVVCLGDIPGEMPEEIKQAMRELYDVLLQELVEGKCHDCGNKIPGEWPPEAEGVDVDLTEGWVFLTAMGSTPDLGILICPDCDANKSRVGLHEN